MTKRIKGVINTTGEIKGKLNYTIVHDGGGDEDSYVDLDGILSICHRGYAGYSNVYENTIEAFEQAAVNGFRFIETDIRHTSDSVAVLTHDPEIYVNEIENTVSISDTTYNELSGYTLRNYTSKIPTLKNFIEFCKENKIVPFLEIKEGTEEQIKADYDLVKLLGYEKSVVWLSFNLQYLQYIKKRMQERG